MEAFDKDLKVIWEDLGEVKDELMVQGGGLMVGGEGSLWCKHGERWSLRMEEMVETATIALVERGKIEGVKVTINIASIIIVGAKAIKSEAMIEANEISVGVNDIIKDGDNLLVNEITVQVDIHHKHY